MSKQEFLKRAVRNMDRDVEYHDPKSGQTKKAKHSNGVKEIGSGSEGRFS
jgi:hypothetical protein